MPNALVLVPTVLLLVPMGYLLIVAPTFLLVKFDVSPVTLLLRGMFNAYFLMMSIAGAIATVAFAVAGRPFFAVGFAVVTALAVSARRWFLRQIDADLSARDAGDADAVHRLRRLHWGGMLYNAVQLVAILGSLQSIAVGPA